MLITTYNDQAGVSVQTDTRWSGMSSFISGGNSQSVFVAAFQQIRFPIEGVSEVT
jgi:hypothetical protein